MATDPETGATPETAAGPADDAAGRLTGLSAAEVQERTAAGQTNVTPRPGGRSTWDIVRTNIFTFFNGIFCTSIKHGKKRIFASCGNGNNALA